MINMCHIMMIMNNEERLHDPILLLKLLMGTAKNFSEDYRQFGYAVSKRFANPALEPLYDINIQYRLRRNRQSFVRRDKIHGSGWVSSEWSSVFLLSDQG
jgi:hypothetical protein